MNASCFCVQFLGVVLFTEIRESEAADGDEGHAFNHGTVEFES